MRAAMEIHIRGAGTFEPLRIKLRDALIEAFAGARQ